MNYVTDEENLVTVMGGAIAVAAALIGGASLVSSGPAAAVVEEVDAKGTPQAPRIGGRQKKKVKASKPVLPKKQKKAADEKKHKWEESDSEEEVVAAPEPAPPQPQGKKKKKGKKAAAEPAPEEEAWVEIPKKVKKKKAAVADTSVEKGGKTVIDLGDKKSAVIGKGGSVIKGIQESSGANIDIEKTSTSCTISGTPEQVKSAKKQINAILSAGSGPSETMDVGKGIGAVIGRGGSTIKSIQAESGAKLDIEKDSEVVKISGSPDQIASAKVLIAEAIEGPKPEATATIQVGDKGGTIIGRGGENIRKVQDQSGARVDMEKGSGVVKISGSKAAVAKAQELIADLLDPKYDAKDFMDVGMDGVPVIVGKGGSNIKRLQQESGAKIDIERGLGSVCAMYGTEEAVKKARALIEAQLRDAKYSETVECPASAIGAVIGKGGETIRSIQEDSGARVNVERDPPSVRLSGAKDSVTKARKLVEAVLAKEAKGKELPKGHIVETVDIPKFAIGSIIGKGGTSIAALQESSGAKVDIQRETDSAKVSGPKESVAKAIKSIKETVAKQEELQAKKAEKGEAEPAPAEKGDGWGENGNSGDW